jgi:hypothetical protein
MFEYQGTWQSHHSLQDSQPLIKVKPGLQANAEYRQQYTHWVAQG